MNAQAVEHGEDEEEWEGFKDPMTEETLNISTPDLFTSSRKQDSKKEFKEPRKNANRQTTSSQNTFEALGLPEEADDGADGFQCDGTHV